MAALASMSTDYYTRLEQQRGPQPSEQMLTALAPALLRVLDRLDDTPALILSNLGETLVQNRMAEALSGDKSQYTGLARSEIYRWFTVPAERLRYLLAVLGPERFAGGPSLTAVPVRRGAR